MGPAEKGHGRIELRRLARVATTPEDIGLTGCRQVLAVERLRHPANGSKVKPTLEIAHYATSYAVDECTDEELAAILRGHWSAIENGVHHRRDVTFGEDAHQVKKVPGAKGGGAPAVLATLRNLAIGAYELARERGRTRAATLRQWCEQQTFTSARGALAG